MGFLFRKKKIEEKTAEEWFKLGRKEKDPEKKIEYYSKCLELDPKNAVAWFAKGLALHGLGRYEEAIRCYDKALDIDPKGAVAWNSKGFALHELGRYEEAIRCYDRALDIDPKNADAQVGKGIALVWLGRYKEAIRCYDKALDIDPKKEVAWNSKGFTLGMLGRHEEAIRCFDKALDINPKDADVWYNKGIALGNLGRYEEAIRCFDRALEIDPGYERAKNNKKLAEEKIREEIERKKVLKTINEVHSLLQQAKNLGINTKSEEEKLNNAKFKLDEKDFSNATKLANECKNSLVRKINEYKQEVERRAKESIDLAYSKIKGAEELGIDVSDAKDLYKKAMLELDNREYEKAKELAEEAKRITLERKSEYEYESAFKSISEAEFAIEKAKEFGCDTSEAEELLNKARAEFERGNHAQSISDARKSEEIAREIKEESKPEMEVVLPEKTFKPNYWKLSLIHISEPTRPY